MLATWALLAWALSVAQGVAAKAPATVPPELRGSRPLPAPFSRAVFEDAASDHQMPFALLLQADSSPPLAPPEWRPSTWENSSVSHTPDAYAISRLLGFAQVPRRFVVPLDSKPGPRPSKGPFLFSLNSSANNTGNASRPSVLEDFLNDPTGDPMVMVIVVFGGIMLVVVLAWMSTLSFGADLAGTTAFMLGAAAGGAFFMEGYVFQDYSLMTAAGHLSALSLFCATFFGGDPCMIDKFVAEVTHQDNEIKRLKDGNDRLEIQLGELESHSAELERLRRDQEVSVAEFDMVLERLDKMVALETIATIVQVFNSADFDRDGKISPENGETLQFIEAIEELRSRYPGFDWKKFETHVHTQGIHFSDMIRIVQAFSEDDPLVAAEALEDIIGHEGEGARANREAFHVERQASGSIARPLEAARGRPFCARAGVPWNPARTPSCSSPKFKASPPPPWQAQLEEQYDEMGGADDPSNGPPAVDRLPGQAVLMISAWRIGLVVSIVSGVGCLSISLIAMSLPTLVCSILGTALAAGLYQSSELLELLLRYRALIKELQAEVSRHRSSEERLTKEVARLDKLRVGYEKLNTKFGGDLKHALESLHDMDIVVKQEVITAITSFFIDADRDGNHVLEGYEIEEFIEFLSVFGHVFELDKVREDLRKNGLTPTQFHSLIERIISESFSAAAIRENERAI